MQKIEIGKTELRALRAMLKKFTPAMDDPRLRAQGGTRATGAPLGAG